MNVLQKKNLTYERNTIYFAHSIKGTSIVGFQWIPGWNFVTVECQRIGISFCARFLSQVFCKKVCEPCANRAAMPKKCCWVHECNAHFACKDRLKAQSTELSPLKIIIKKNTVCINRAFTTGKLQLPFDHQRAQRGHNLHLSISGSFHGGPARGLW